MCQTNARHQCLIHNAPVGHHDRAPAQAWPSPSPNQTRQCRYSPHHGSPPPAPQSSPPAGHQQTPPCARGSDAQAPSHRPHPPLRWAHHCAKQCAKPRDPLFHLFFRPQTSRPDAHQPPHIQPMPAKARGIQNQCSFWSNPTPYRLSALKILTRGQTNGRVPRPPNLRQTATKCCGL